VIKLDSSLKQASFDHGEITVNGTSDEHKTELKRIIEGHFERSRKDFLRGEV